MKLFTDIVLQACNRPFVHTNTFSTKQSVSGAALGASLLGMDRYSYRVEIQQMMFVAGSSDPPLHTVCLVEDIVRAQVVELISRGMALARKRGARTVTVEDIMFLIRHDVAKVNRLSTYLAWKDVRKNARDQGDGGQADADILEDAVDVPGAAGGQPANAPAAASKAKKAKFSLPWKPQFMFAIPMLDSDLAAAANEGDSDEDDDDDEANQLMNERLRNADLRTQNMTREEYVHWSECRQASFTFRKNKRFREWAGIGQLTDTRLQDDIMDVLGFLTFEVVANLTERALKIKQQWETRFKQRQAQTQGNAAIEKRRRPAALFYRPSLEETPLLPEHMRAAYADFQDPTPKNLAMRTFLRGKVDYSTKLI